VKLTGEQMKKTRIDQLLVRRELVPSREVAQRLILAGKVRAGEKLITKPGQLVPEAENIQLLEDLKYVSRGGYKLEHALDQFGVKVEKRIILDVGASTGGFTDCLLQRGAGHVYAVDVGYGQLSWKLRQDPRVTVFERVNARYLEKRMFYEEIDLAVMDVSFIGAQKILKPLLSITSEIILLLKPQFEAGPEDVPRGGIIRDSSVHRKVLLSFYRHLEPWKIQGLIDSPILGSSGNREFLVHLRKNHGWNESYYLQKVEELVG